MTRLAEPPRSASPTLSPVTETESSGLAGSAAPSRWGLSSLRRVTSSGRFIPEIDGLRFAAILAVYVYHVNAYLLEKGTHTPGDGSQGLLVRALEHGHYGVQLFFIISGFVLALPFASHYLRGSKPVSLRAYFLRRLTRLEPPYIVAMIGLFALRVLYLGDSASNLLPNLGASLLYMHTLIYGTLSVINAVAWSLEVEIQFYVLVPLLARVFAISNATKRRLIICAVILAEIAFQAVWVSSKTPRIQLSIFGQLQYFLLGFLLADLYVSEWRSKPDRNRVWDIVSLIGWPMLPVLWHYPQVSRWVFPPLALALYCATFRGVWSSRLFSIPWLTTIGGMCYTIYLLHWPIITFVGRQTIDIRMSSSYAGLYITQFLLMTPVVLAVSAVYFAMIEKPCMRPDWPQRLAARLRAGVPARRSA
jgi:peptidoglycan/LPS O-acetylase OafA/YrhL